MMSFRMMDFPLVLLFTLLSRPLMISSEGQCHCPTAKHLSWRQSLLYCQSLNSSLASLNQEKYRARTCLFGQTKYWTGRYKMESDWIEVAGCYVFGAGQQYNKSAVNIDASSCFAFCHGFPYFGLEKNRCVCLSNQATWIESYENASCVPCSNKRYLCGNNGHIAVYRNASKPVTNFKGQQQFPKCAAISCESGSWSYFEYDCTSELIVFCKNDYMGIMSKDDEFVSFNNASEICFRKKSQLVGADDAISICGTGLIWTHTLKDLVVLNTSLSDIYEYKKPVMCEYISFSPETKYTFGNCDDAQGFACLKNENVTENCTLKGGEKKIAAEENNTVSIAVGCVVGVVLIVLIVVFVCYRLRFKKSKPVNHNKCNEGKSTSTDNITTAKNVSSNEYNEIGHFQNASYEMIDDDDIQATADRKTNPSNSFEPSSKRQNVGGAGPTAAEKNNTNINKNQYSFARRVYDHTQTPNQNNDVKEDDYDHLSNDKRNPDKNFPDRNDDDYAKAPISPKTDDDYDKFDRNKVTSVQPSFNYDHVHLREQHRDNESPEDDLEDYDHLQRSPKIHDFVDSTYDHTRSVTTESPNPASNNYDSLP